MGKVKADYLIIGQGLAGSWLAYEMIQRDLSVVIFDEDKGDTSSKKAAGIYNPITGRKMVKTWRADQLFPSLESNYEKLERELKKSFLHKIPIYRPFRSVEDQNDWQGNRGNETFDRFINDIPPKSIGYEDVNDPFGGIILNHSGYVDIPQMLQSLKSFFIDKGIYRAEVFDYEKMKIENESVDYQNIVASKAIFCEGISSNPYWKLPFKPVRGEIIDIECSLSSQHIINQGVFMIPKDNKFTVGSTYDHNNLTFEPQESGIRILEDRFKKLYNGDYRILDKRAGVRPATHDRKPYIGFHSEHKTLGIFNGFGTKGVSLTPHFAKHFVDVLLGVDEIDEEVNVQRVS
ncbi:NAD(P)/FAD-dependent oxidoreductase [Ekhidna sp.]|uniref:NAD(P)/FAD-dependent oxidoreductase n=1 Tax=Ekhidna sp. TaxID=2608089 RepID=UPI003B502DDC